MVYLIIAEVRCGGTKLAEWLKMSLGNSFINVQEPYRETQFEFTNSTNPTDISWIDPRKNYVIKELWNPNWDYSELIKISDNVLCVYRENWYQQIKSLLFAQKTDKWHKKYTEKEVNSLVDENEIELFYEDNFREVKRGFQKWIGKNDFQSFSYENLYFGDAITNLKKIYPVQNDIPFPLGTKYLTKERFLI